MLEVGKKAPDFELPDQNGEMHKLSDYAGRLLLLTTQCDILVKKYETCVKISTLPLTVLIQSAII